MKTAQQKTNLNLIIYSCIIISLIITPNLNKDALIVPKVILLFCLALYLIPNIMSSKSIFSNNIILKKLIIILVLIVIQLTIIMIKSDAPFAQEIFGRTGRGLGFITTVSLLIIMVGTAISVKFEQLNIILFGMFLSALISSIYSICQRFGIDFVVWDARNNGIIGTLGNPNFQSIFAAMVFLPTLVIFFNKKNGKFYSAVFGILFLYTVFITQSTQGYIGVLASLVIFALLFFWYTKRNYFYIFLVFTFFFASFSIAGMLGHGPISSVLYKISVQSRGDFWRSAFNMANNNPFFGVGLDSFGDYYLKYRDTTATKHTFAEFTDNAHNYFLEWASTGGYLLLILNLILIIITVISFISIQKKLNVFNRELAALFTILIVFQLQSIISPGNLVLMTWNAVVSGALIGIAADIHYSNPPIINRFKLILSRVILTITGLIFVFPFFNVDRLELEAAKTHNGDLAINSAILYPESVLRYSRLAQELFDSKLYEESLYLAKKSVAFNPNAGSGWVMILINPKATKEDKLLAKLEIIRLDPLNEEVRNFKVQ
jgi:O-antigen ligase